jgi:hypothetical protein
VEICKEKKCKGCTVKEIGNRGTEKRKNVWRNGPYTRKEKYELQYTVRKRLQIPLYIIMGAGR